MNRMVGGSSRDDVVGEASGGADHSVESSTPLRMVINSQLIGTTDGQRGCNISQIAVNCGTLCEIDQNPVMRNSMETDERVISIYGTAATCSMTCQQILELMNQAGEHPSQNLSTELKLRADDCYIGRLIGRSGCNLQKLMEETKCTISVSRFAEVLPGYLLEARSHATTKLERTITIRGSVENIMQAEQKISQLLRHWRKPIDRASIAVQNGTIHGPQRRNLHSRTSCFLTSYPNILRSDHSGSATPAGPEAMNPSDTVGNPIVTSADSVPKTSTRKSSPSVSSASTKNMAPDSFYEMLYIWAHKESVSLLIGSNCEHIRDIVRQTGSIILTDTIESGSCGGEISSERPDMNVDRNITLICDEHQQYKTQLWAFEGLSKAEGRPFEEFRLRVDVELPSQIADQVVEKVGKNSVFLRDMAGAEVSTLKEKGITFVTIVGSFIQSQAAQACIRNWIHQFYSKSTSNDQSNHSDETQHDESEL